MDACTSIQYASCVSFILSLIGTVSSPIGLAFFWIYFLACGIVPSRASSYMTWFWSVRRFSIVLEFNFDAFPSCRIPWRAAFTNRRAMVPCGALLKLRAEEEWHRRRGTAFAPKTGGIAPSMQISQLVTWGSSTDHNLHLEGRSGSENKCMSYQRP